ncbi:hypothetical protein BX070DRAFT_252700 [Coemansia spiralis]|nr:hypothetical protein BX070DRAFT_252700 [Coemansia spiralis]
MSSLSNVRDVFEPSSSGLTVRLFLLLSVLGIYSAFAVSTTFVMIHRYMYRRDSFLVNRSVPLVVVQAIFGTFVGSASLVCTALRLYPCALKIWVLYLGVLMWLAIVAARAMQRCVLFWPASQQQSTPRHSLVSMDFVTGQIESSAGDSSTLSCNAHTPRFDSRPNTGNRTLNAWSEFDFPARNSQSTLRCTHSDSPVILHQQPRFGRIVTTKALFTFLVPFGILLALVALIICIKSPRYSLQKIHIQAICWDDGWEAWVIYSIAIACVGILFPVLAVKLWKATDVHGTRNDILFCMFSSQATLIIYVLWETALKSIRGYVSELFVFWLAGLVTHISSVYLPLRQNATNRDRVVAQQPQVGVSNTYKGPHLRRSLYSSLFSEFRQMMQDSAQREEFLKFTTQYYRSAIPAFLGDFQLLKYKTIEALWQEQQDRTPACCQHHRNQHQHHQRLNSANTTPICRCGKAETPSGSAVSENGIGAVPASVCVAAQLLSQQGSSRSPIQMVADTQRPHDSHPLSSLVPITKGILESATLVLPLRTVDQTTHFPEAVKSAFASFVYTYFSKGSYMSINIPNEIVNEVQVAVEESNVVLSVLDHAKDEVLFLLCTDVFTGYRRRMEAQRE